MDSGEVVVVLRSKYWTKAIALSERNWNARDVRCGGSFKIVAVSIAEHATLDLKTGFRTIRDKFHEIMKE